FQVIEHKKMDEIQPVIRALETEPDLKKQFEVWARTRDEFNKSLTDRDPEAVKAGWQKWYFKGEKPTPQGEVVPHDGGHMNRRRLKAPIMARLKK
ncbi:MAG: hypothetical protein JF615_05570, partial [Asticcacaulis sp.]|nr:hypothetical protein [Asticcacaulis sp.]